MSHRASHARLLKWARQHARLRERRPFFAFSPKKSLGLSIPAGVVRRDGRARHSGHRTPGSEPVGDTTMRYMILVKATKDSEAGVMPPEELLAAMADYHEQLAKAGVLLDGKRAATKLEGLAHQIFRRQAHRDRRALRRDERTRRRLHDHSSEVQAGGDGMGAGAFPILTSRRARSRSVKCSSWKISARAKRLIGFARWDSPRQK